MIITDMDVKKAPTKEQLEMLEKAEKMPITFDEDCPELSNEELKNFTHVKNKQS